jgi:hypothetical protein
VLPEAGSRRCMLPAGVDRIAKIKAIVRAARGGTTSARRGQPERSRIDRLARQWREGRRLGDLGDGAATRELVRASVRSLGDGMS